MNHTGPVIDHVVTGWDPFLHWARLFFERPDFDVEERTYKLKAALRLADARRAHQRGGDWLGELRAAYGLTNVVSHWTFMPFRDWAMAEPTAASDALAALWQEKADLDARLERFDRLLPGHVVSGPGLRCNLASFLLGALEPTNLPVFKSSPFDLGYALTRTAPPPASSDMRTRYECALALLDELLARGRASGMELKDRLDAQGVLWCVTQWGRPADWTAEAWDAFETWRATPRRKSPAGSASKAGGKKVVRRPPPKPVCSLCANDDNVRRIGPIGDGVWAFECEAGPHHAEPHSFQISG